MSEIFVRSGGQVYGPYSQQQYASLVSSGRVTPATEVSTDRTTWVPAARFKSDTAGRPVGASTRSGRAGASTYLTELRGRTNYPIYRAVVLIFSILGFIGAALPTIGHVILVLRFGLEDYFKTVEGQEWMIVMPFFVSAMVAVGVKFYQEFATMIVDFVDSTIDHHSRH
jgi:hypothetical protein